MRMEEARGPLALSDGLLATDRFWERQDSLISLIYLPVNLSNSGEQSQIEYHADSLIQLRESQTKAKRHESEKGMYREGRMKGEKNERDI